MCPDTRVCASASPITTFLYVLPPLILSSILHTYISIYKIYLLLAHYFYLYNIYHIIILLYYYSILLIYIILLFYIIISYKSFSTDFLRLFLLRKSTSIISRFAFHFVIIYIWPSYHMLFLILLITLIGYDLIFLL
jgi:hypothetical protein